MIRILGTIFDGLVGLAFGSFLNVCLSRWPAGESIVKPRSHCRGCDRTLAWWENVPLLSWLALRGRCRSCGASIGWRYLLVELGVGFLWAFIFWQTANHYAGVEVVSFSPLGLTEKVVAVCGTMLLAWLLVGLAALDAEHLWLPNFLIYPGIVLGLAYSIASLGLLWPFDGDPGSLRIFAGRLGFVLLDRLIAVLVAAGLILLIRWTYWLIRRREGIGLGDAKLTAMLAVWLGLPGAMLAFAIGVVLGAAVGIAMLLVPRLRHSDDTPALTKLPLGTFLCIGGIISSLWGRPILAAYLRWSGLS